MGDGQASSRPSRSTIGGFWAYLGATPTSAHAQAAADQPRIIYIETRTVDDVRHSTFVTVNMDGTDRRTLTPSGPDLPAADLVSPVYSPDGRHLAFISDFSDVWVADADGTDARPVARDVQDPDGWLSHLAWGPDSDMLYLDFRSKPGHSRLRLMRVNLDGTGLGYVFATPAQTWDTRPSAAPDGRLAFQRGSSVRIHDPRTAGEPQLVGLGYAPTFAPDGKSVAFTRFVTTTEVIVHDLTTATDTQLTEGTNGVMYPSWSPDGEHLLYLSGGTPSYLTVHSARTPGGAGTKLTGRDVEVADASWVIPPQGS
ncbi:TolB family protein [Streptomyces sp. LZ34]